MDAHTHSSEKHRLQEELNTANSEVWRHRQQMRVMEKEALGIKEEMATLKEQLQDLMGMSDEFAFNRIQSLSIRRI